MQTVKIGVQDKEPGYCIKLAEFLNQRGAGRWKAVAFTENGALSEYLAKKQMDILVGTDMEELIGAKKKQENLSVLWLTEKSEGSGIKKEQIKGMEVVALERYQSAKTIYESIRRLVEQKRIHLQERVSLAAIYSPVGRCGKTTLALNIVREQTYGSWLYVGMEDYSGLLENMGEMGIRAEDFLYFLKERLEDKLFCLLKECEGIIPTAFSFLDTRQLAKEDIFWLREEVKKQGIYQGILFDLGTGVLQDLELLGIFDYLFVPYLNQPSAVAKRLRLEDLLLTQEMEDVRERMILLDMGDWQEIDKRIRTLLKG